MIVRYMRERGYKGDGEDPYLTLGKDYVVLEIIYNAHENLFKIVFNGNNEEGAGVWDIKFFDIVDGRIPNDWIIEKYDSGNISFSPQEFCGDFWELFHDDDHESAIVFQEVLNKIRKFHGWPVPSMKKYFAKQLLQQMETEFYPEKLALWAQNYNPDSILEAYKARELDSEIKSLLKDMEIMDLHEDLLISEEKLRNMCAQWIDDGIIDSNT